MNIKIRFFSPFRYHVLGSNLLTYFGLFFFTNEIQDENFDELLNGWKFCFHIRLWFLWALEGPICYEFLVESWYIMTNCRSVAS